MTITINGTTGIAGVDGSAATPAVQGNDTNTGVFYPAADTVGVSTGGSERMRVDSSGQVGIGTTSPDANLEVSGTVTRLYFTRYSSDFTAPIVHLRKARGTEASKVILNSGDDLGQINFAGYDGAAFLPVGRIRAELDGTPGLNDMPTRMTFSTTSSGGATSTERLRIANAGQIGIGGANYGTSGQVIMSTGSTTAPTWSTVSGAGNRIINGGMTVDQRNLGATQTFTAGAALAYSVDRWYGYCTGANVTGARIAGAIANQFRYRFTGAASVTAIGFGQRIEAVNSSDLAGSTATLSVVLSNSLLTSVTWTAYYANTTDTFGSLASPTVTSIATGTFTVTSTPTQYSTNISIPAAATTGIQILFTVGAQTSGTWTIADVQLEAGSVATPFQYKNIREISADCYRYYYRITPAKVNGTLGIGDVATTSTFRVTSILPIPMRIQPTALEQSGTATDYAVRTGTTTTAGATTVPTFTGTANTSPMSVQSTITTGATLTVGQAGEGRLSATVSTGYLGWSAEL